MFLPTAHLLKRSTSFRRPLSANTRSPAAEKKKTLHTWLRFLKPVCSCFSVLVLHALLDSRFSSFGQAFLSVVIRFSGRWESWIWDFWSKSLDSQILLWARPVFVYLCQRLGVPIVFRLANGHALFSLTWDFGERKFHQKLASSFLQFNLAPPDHLLLDSAPNLGPLIN